jgi:hypothetical protein
MKLAEALAVRSDASKRFEQLRSRAQANARYQEGEPPAENAGELLAEADRVLAELEDLIRRINRTNAATMLDEQMTVTDAIARRDVLRWRHSLYTSVADAASGGLWAGDGPSDALRAAVCVGAHGQRAADGCRRGRKAASGT